MTATTLVLTDVVTLDSTGSGVVTLKPAVGQNWAPLFVRVSTNNLGAPVAYCALYHGSPGVPVQQSQFIDDTFTGSGDTSSMISGTPVRFGEALLFQFTGGNPGDTAVATVYGMTSDLPPNFDLIPQVPGTHFSGHLITEVVKTLTIQGVAGVGAPVIITSGSTVTSPLIDVRQFASYYLDLKVTAGPAVTDYNAVSVDFIWTSDSSLVPLHTVFRDKLQIWADTVSAPVVSLGDLRAQDTMHGAYMQFAMTNLGPDTCHATWTLMGTTRVLPGPYVRQGDSPDGILVSQQDNIPVGGTLLIPMPVAYGQVEWWLFNQGAAAMTPFIDYGASGNDQVGAAVAANSLGTFNLVMPKRAGLLQVNGTAGQTVDNRVITNYNKS